MRPPLGPMKDSWEHLRRFTGARLALGSAGHSIPTPPLLEFQLAHALARDAIYAPFEAQSLRTQLAGMGHDAVVLSSAARDRETYLHRPDLGRQLDERSRALLAARPARDGCDLLFVVADGLSPLAVNRHAVPLLREVLATLSPAALRIGPVFLVEQGRVAIGDEIGTAQSAGLVAVLIGERPGLSTPDSLGIYLTYGPRPGITDASRNCISNVHAEGLSYPEAAHRLAYLVREALRRQLTGVRLKEEAHTALPPARGATDEERNVTSTSPPAPLTDRMDH